MRRVVVMLLAVAGTAAADEPTVTGPASIPLPVVPLTSGRPFSDQIADKLTDLGYAVDGRLGPLTMDVVDVRFDGRARRARVRLRGETRYLSLVLDGDIHFRHGAAEVDARIELGIGGHALQLELPGFEVVPRSYAGERYLEVRLPLISRRF